MKEKKEGISGTSVKTPQSTNIQQTQSPDGRVKHTAQKPPKRKEPEGRTPAEEEAERQRKGKSRVEEVVEKMDTLKTTPPKYFSETMREFPERVCSYLYSQGRERYDYFAMFPLAKTEEEHKHIKRHMKDPQLVFSLSPIRGIPELTTSITKKNILTVRFKVRREDGSEMSFSDVDLHNLCCYDLTELHGLLFNQEGTHRKYSLAKLKVIQAMKESVRKNARKDFQLALALGLEKTDLERPDEELYNLGVTDVYVPVPEAGGMTYLNEEGELRLYRMQNSMKYSDDTLKFLYQQLFEARGNWSPEQELTKEQVLESFITQVTYRKQIMKMVNVLKEISEEARTLDRFLNEKPLF